MLLEIPLTHQQELRLRKIAVHKEDTDLAHCARRILLNALADEYIHISSKAASEVQAS